ncbi:MAG: hypothetical protein R3Y24_14630 [Eubacteriales bacterium]
MVNEMRKAETQRKKDIARAEKQRQMNLKRAQLLRELENRKKHETEQIKRAEDLTNDLLSKYEFYNKMSDQLLQKRNEFIFSFESVKRQYETVDFYYAKEEPVLRNSVIESPNLLEVPKETWMEKIFTSKREKRLSVIAQNDSTVERIKKENQDRKEEVLLAYQKELEEYEKAMKEAKELWIKSECQQEIEIQAWNESVSYQENEYANGECESVEKYVKNLITTYDYHGDIIEHAEVGYNKHYGKIVVDLYIKNRNAIFIGAGYKYLMGRDEIDIIKIKVSELNIFVKKLTTELNLATILLLVINDKMNHLEKIIVNVYHEQVCCVSTSVSKEEFLKYNLELETEKEKFIQAQAKVFKQFARGAKAFETLHKDME